MYVYVCVRLRGIHTIISGVILTLNDWLNNVHLLFSYVRFMVFAVDIIDMRGPGYEMCCQLKPKKAKVRLNWPFIQQQMMFHLPFIANKTKCFSFKSVRVKNGKMHCQLKPKKAKV